jgi:uncharacterized protein (UPF0303 family)
MNGRQENINKLQQNNNRILIIQMDKDDSSQYTKIVKGIFAAKKMNVTIDALILNETSA